MQKNKVYLHYEFIRDYGQFEVFPSYLIYGNEPFLQDQILHLILKKLLPAARNDFDLIKLYGDETRAAQVVEHLEMPPFLAEYRIVILRNFDQMDNNDKNLLADYLDQPLSTSILILLAEKCDRRIAACKKVCSASLCVECKPPYDQRDINRWLQAELRNRRLQMSPEAVNTFAGYIEPDYLIASNELEKLIILNRGRQMISNEDVLECVGRSRSANIYELQNALGHKKMNTALSILENMLANNESAVFIVTMLTYFFLTLWKIQLLRRNKASDRQISEQSLPEIYPAYRQNYLHFAADYPLASLRRIHLLLLQADTDLKSLDLDERIILEMLVFRILRSAE